MRFGGTGSNKGRTVRLLIAVGETVSDETEVPAGVRLIVDAASEILVMSPSLVGRLDWLTGEVDRARRVANERLSTALGQLGSLGVTVEGVRGDELLHSAFDDAIADFRPEHVLIVVPGQDYAVWQRQGVLEHLLDRARLPVTVFATD